MTFYGQELIVRQIHELGDYICTGGRRGKHDQKAPKVLQKSYPICTTSYFTDIHNPTQGKGASHSLRHSSLGQTGGIARWLQPLV